MTDNLIHWSDEAQLLGYGESDSTGAWLKFRVTPEDLEHFRGLKGVVFYLTTVQMAGDGKPVEKAPRATKEAKPYGHQAAALHANGFLLVPAVLKAAGTDADFLEWIRTEDCAIRDDPKWPIAVHHHGDVVAAHVRRVANGAGTGIKPEYSAIPLCHEHHTKQHQLGESAFGGKEWFDRQRIKYVSTWASQAIAKVFNQPSLGYVAPEDLRAWAEANQVEQWLPVEYRATV